MTSRHLVIIAALVLSLSAAASGQDAAPEPAGAIPAAEIATRAAEVAALLETVDAVSAPTPERLEIERLLSERSGRLQAGWETSLRRLAAGPSAPQLEDMATAWGGVRAELQSWADQLSAHAGRLQQELRRLADLQAAWSKSGNEAQASSAPPQVLEEIRGILGAIQAAEARVNTRLAGLLVLQYQVGLQVRRADQMLARIAQAQAELTRHLARRNAAAVWSPELWAAAQRQVAPGIRAAAARWAGGLRTAVQSQARGILLQALLFALVLLAVLRVRRRAQAWVLPGSGMAGAARMLERPVSAALVLTLFATPWLYPGYSLAIFRTAKLAGIIPAVRLLTPLVSAAQARSLIAFGAVMALEAVRPLLVTAPDLDHLVFLAEMLAASILLGLIVLGQRPAAAPPAAGREGQGQEAPARPDPRTAALPAHPVPARLGVARLVSILGLVFALALLTGAGGYMQLARLLGDAAFQSTHAALAILINVWVLLVLFAHALWAPPLGSLEAVRRNRAFLERSAGRLLRGIGIATWVVLSLRPLTVFGKAGDLLSAVLTAGVGWGGFRITVGDVLVFGVTVWAAFLLSAAVSAILEADVFPRVRLGQGVPLALANLTRYAIVLTGFMVGLAALGVDLTKVTILLGAVGVGVGFGLQTLVGNFAAGLILLFERPIREGDAVQVGDVHGEVRHIGVRASTVRTAKGAVVFVPNAQLLTEKVTNWTYAGGLLRVDLPVTVASGTDPRQVMDLLCRVAEKHPDILHEPPPAPLCLGFGPAGLAVELRAWTRRFERAEVIRSELAEAASAALTENKVAFK